IGRRGGDPVAGLRRGDGRNRAVMSGVEPDALGPGRQQFEQAEAPVVTDGEADRAVVHRLQERVARRSVVLVALPRKLVGVTVGVDDIPFPRAFLVGADAPVLVTLDWFDEPRVFRRGLLEAATTQVEVPQLARGAAIRITRVPGALVVEREVAAIGREAHAPEAG